MLAAVRDAFGAPVLAVLITVTAESTGGPDGAAVNLTKFGDYISILSNGAAWHEVADCGPTPELWRLRLDSQQRRRLA